MTCPRLAAAPPRRSGKRCARAVARRANEGAGRKTLPDPMPKTRKIRGAGQSKSSSANKCRIAKRRVDRAPKTTGDRVRPARVDNRRVATRRHRRAMAPAESTFKICCAGRAKARSDGKRRTCSMVPAAETSGRRRERCCADSRKATVPRGAERRTRRADVQAGCASYRDSRDRVVPVAASKRGVAAGLHVPVSKTGSNGACRRSNARSNRSPRNFGRCARRSRAVKIVSSLRRVRDGRDRANVGQVRVDRNRAARRRVDRNHADRNRADRRRVDRRRVDRNRAAHSRADRNRVDRNRAARRRVKAGRSAVALRDSGADPEVATAARTCNEARSDSDEDSGAHKDAGSLRVLTARRARDSAAAFSA